MSAPAEYIEEDEYCEKRKEEAGELEEEMKGEVKGVEGGGGETHKAKQRKANLINAARVSNHLGESADILTGY